MADQGFPGQHSTTTTVTSSNTVVQTNLRFDPTYIRTLPGLLKCIMIVLNLLGFICISASKYSGYSRGTYFNMVAMGGFWVTGILLCFYLFHVIERTFRCPWVHFELFFNFTWTILYLIASILAVNFASYDGLYAAASFFGFCSTVAYGFDSYLKYQIYKSGDLLQGVRSVSKTTSTVTAMA